MCNIGFCEVCVGYETCKLCAKGFVLISSAFCIPCPSHCYYCVQSGSCEICKNGYYLTNQKCKPCASQCAMCSNSATNCTICNGASVFYGGHCTDCFALIPSCTSCFINGTDVICTSCLIGYYSAGFSCELCSNNCIICSNSSVCIDCELGYFLTNQSAC